MKYRLLLIACLSIIYSGPLFSQSKTWAIDLGVNLNGEGILNSSNLGLSYQSKRFVFKLEFIGLPQNTNNIITHTYDSSNFRDLGNDEYLVNEGKMSFSTPLCALTCLRKMVITESINLFHGVGVGWKYSKSEENTGFRVDGLLTNPDGSKELLFGGYRSEVYNTSSNYFMMWYYIGIQKEFNGNFYANISIRPDVNYAKNKSRIYATNQGIDFITGTLKPTPPTYYNVENTERRIGVLTNLLPFISLGLRL